MEAKGKSASWPEGLHHVARQDGAARGAGTPLPGDLRKRLESHLGADLSDVRVHTNSAVVAGQGGQARAFTTGQDIFFRAGAYNPHSAEGQKLLAHELTHTIQQKSAGAPPSSGGPAAPSPVPIPYPVFGMPAKRPAS